MLLDQDTKYALDSILAAKPDGPSQSYSYPYLCNVISMDEDHMFPVIKSLVDKGLAEYAYAVNSRSRRDVGIVLTQNGRKYKEIGRLERRERWKERICGFLAGVASSVLAAIIISRFGL